MKRAPKLVYFVRHGESEGNVDTSIRKEDSPLTENGRRQAHLIAKRVADLTIDHIISSTMVRARHTAQAIADELKKDIEFSDLFVEQKRPTETYGLDMGSETFKSIETAVKEHWGDPTWHYSDEENAADLKKRVEGGLRYLEHSDHGHILVVTHGRTLRALIGSMLFKDKFSGYEFGRLVLGVRTRNTGITVAEYDSLNMNNGWRLLTFNDHTHLPH